MTNLNYKYTLQCSTSNTKVRLNQQKRGFKTAARYIVSYHCQYNTPRTFARLLTVNEAKMYSNSEKQNKKTFSLAEGH